MSRDLVTVSPGTTVGRVAALFRTHGFTSIPVVTGDNRLEGVIFQIDLIRSARRAARSRHSGFLAALSHLIRAADLTSPRARDTMSVDLPTVSKDVPVGALLPLLKDGRAEAVPVIEGDCIIGIVTRYHQHRHQIRSSLRAGT